MIDCKTFQETYKKIKETEDKNFFDRLLIPLVSSLNYKMQSFNSSGGTMLIEHNKKLIKAFPDNNLTIVFTFNDVTYKYDRYTLLFSLNLSKEEINIKMPYFGEYKTVLKTSFFGNEKKYENIMSILDFKVLNSVDLHTRQELFYQLIIKCDIKNKNKYSKLFLFEINKLLQNADEDLINLISNKIYQQSNYDINKLNNHFSNLLKNQNEDNNYQIINTFEKKQIEKEKQKSEPVKGNSLLSIANDVINDENNKKEKGDRIVNVAKSFKQ